MNEFKGFAIGGGVGSPNTLTPSAWAALTTLLANGFQNGTALPEQANTVWRQTSTVAAAIAQFCDNWGPEDALDNGNITQFLANFKAALDALYIQDLGPYLRADAFTGSPEQSITTSGWQKLPGGFLEQWGVLPIPAGSSVQTIALTFPRTFANGCYNVTGNADGPANGSWNPIIVTPVRSSMNPSGINIIVDTGNSGQGINAGRNVMWRAIGYDTSI